MIIEPAFPSSVGLLRLNDANRRRMSWIESRVPAQTPAAWCQVKGHRRHVFAGRNRPEYPVPSPGGDAVQARTFRAHGLSAPIPSHRYAMFNRQDGRCSCHQNGQAPCSPTSANSPSNPGDTRARQRPQQRFQSPVPRHGPALRRCVRSGPARLNQTWMSFTVPTRAILDHSMARERPRACAGAA